MKKTLKVICIICVISLIILFTIKNLKKSNNLERDFEKEQQVLAIIEEDRNNYMGQGDEYISYWAPKQAILDEEIDKLFIRHLEEKYYEELMNNISSEMKENSSEIPKSTKKLVREAINLYNGNKITDYEKEVLKYIFEGIYFTVSTEDSKLADELNTTGIEFK